MPAALGMDEYKRRLRQKFGSDLNVRGTYESMLSLLTHNCPKCKKDYTATPQTLLSFKKLASCTPCSRKAINDGTRITVEVMEAKLAKKFKGKLTMTNFVSAHKPATFRCKCGDTWENKPYEVLKSKTGQCRACASKKMAKKRRSTHAQFMAAFKASKRTDLKILGKYTKSQEPIKVSCTTCKHVWDSQPNRILFSNSGCPECSKRNRMLRTKDVKIAGRKFCVQGYEPQVIEDLVARGCPVKAIHVFSGGKVPIIPYTFNGQDKEYWPDIRVGKAIYEVKSDYTLLAEFKKNVAKAKAVIATGRKFYLMVYLPEEDRVLRLPKDWYKMKEDEVRKYIRRQTLNELTILSMDPGTTNHAWSVLKVSRPFKVQVVASGMIENTVKDLKGNMRPKVLEYVGEIAELVEMYGATHLIMERYMARGMKGATIECVNVMIGAVLSALGLARLGVRGKNALLIPASQWKNEWNRRSSLENFYKKVNCVAHQVDSVGIGLYGAAHWLDEKPFEGIVKLEKVLAKQINATNLGKAIKGR